MKTEIGKTITFRELFEAEVQKIEIPIIQRDYAQGRDSAKEIRTNFLRNIKKSMDTGAILNLDFIYGSIENKTFIPIDGQQRLTTLFLLHWYLAWRSNNLDSMREIIGITESKFTYKTRISSRDFCKFLVVEDFAFTTEKSIPNIIKDQHWFYLNWINDATITGMLNTLETINEIFEDADKYYQLIISKTTPPITFQYIELKDFGLSDHLYIKMNSRGKALTDFENIKANVEKIYEEYDKENSTKHSQWLSTNLDNKWTDLFWGFLVDKTKLVDDFFLNFIRVSITNEFALSDDFDIEKLKELLDSKRTFNFFMLENIGKANFQTMNHTFMQLDALTNNNGDYEKYISDTGLLDEIALFTDIINDETTFVKRIQLFALCEFLRLKKDNSKLNDWMRIIRNLTENSRIEIDEYPKALATVKSLLDNSETILNYISKVKNDELPGFNEKQCSEEIVKAKLILSNLNWRDKLISIENHPYLKGFIGFVLDFSSIPESIDFLQVSNLDKLIETNSMGLFDDYSAKFNQLFVQDGIISFDNHLFERALFTFGDYTLPKRSNWSFLLNGNDRDISWKSLLRDEKASILKLLMDKINFKYIEKSLQAEINDFHDVEDWRYYFIKYSKIIDNTGPFKYIRFKDENDILLLEKKQLNGINREYYSFAILCELEEMGYEVEYYTNIGDEWQSKYIESINENEIHISFIPKGEYFGYWVEPIFLEDNEDEELHFKTHKDVIKYVRKNIV